MYEELPVDILTAHPKNSNRISKLFSKKLINNIRQTGLYETITVRPHPSEKNKFEILNGHVRLDALNSIGQKTVKCDIWDIDDTKASLFLAILNKLRGSDVPELRMNLLYDLLDRYTNEELVSHVPETSSYLRKLELLPKEIMIEKEDKKKLTNIVIITFYLQSEKHRIVTEVLDKIQDKYDLSDSSEALFKLTQIYLQKELSERPASMVSDGPNKIE